MSDLKHIVHEQRAYLDAREQATRATRAATAAITATAPGPPATTDAGHTAGMSRRRLLRRAVQATAAAVVAGALVQHEGGDAAAANDITADGVFAHLLYGAVVRAENQDGQIAFTASTDSDIYAASIYNAGSGTGLYSVTVGDGPAVLGVAAADAGTPGYGVVGAAAYGVVGQSLTTEPGFPGVWGQSATGVGTGVLGEGKVGVHGKVTSSGGYAGVFEGGKAQLRLVPSTAVGKPTTGQHLKGELFLDRNADLWFCTAGGSPGTWKKVTLT